MEPDPSSNVDVRASSRRVAFLLSQVGGLAASKFAERVSDLGVTPSDVGLLRVIATTPGLSQRGLADALGVGPSRVVALVDGLEDRGLVERTRSETDRRNHELRLTDAGRSVMTAMRTVGAAHERDLLAALTDEERIFLGEILAKVAEANQLLPDVHPGFHRTTKR
ncbi:MarR family winged helix-turn-helix transcriptional regulator [Paramicrobacterium chengjingii]|uniref:MarR family transcriptional regulator n=1 Tax=Paramicrobacterium chengjingii TaxID=2769067 RepID=A0ABX6YJG1_9MICO|nr:MarR family transcriptional regulator [Microbacterium chengjingii]QPZ38734.1 MarR family transcriptional regulator [Microbacterium chengjingii]